METGAGAVDELFRAFSHGWEGGRRHGPGGAEGQLHSTPSNPCFSFPTLKCSSALGTGQANLAHDRRVVSESGQPSVRKAR